MSANQTLYVNNINEKLKRDDLRRALYLLFTYYGTVLDVVASKGYKRRGQAFVVFRSSDDAAAAMRALNEFQFYGKPLRVQFARGKSDVVAKLDGTWDPKARQDRKERRERLRREFPTKKSAEKRRLDDDGPDRKRHKPDAAAVSLAKDALIPDAPPNSLLLAQNLPPETSESAVSDLFRAHAPHGFKEVRIPPNRRDLAFVEYVDITSATAAKNTLHRTVFSTHLLFLTFAK